MNTALQLNFIAFSFLTITLANGVYTYPDVDSKKYGDTCDGMEYCHGELVSCQYGVCSCYHPDDMVYNEYSQGCVVLAGKKCEINALGHVACIEGALCNENGICTCADGYYLNNQTCVQKKMFKEACTTDQECQIYDEERKACVAVVDSECEMEDESFECTSNTICGQGRCVCKPNFAKSTSQECKLGYGSECNNAHHCADIYFMCLDGRFVCKHPLHQVFDERTQECLSLVSGPCTFPTKENRNVTGIYDIQKCIKNAECVDKGFYSECECRPGYVQTKTETCAPGLGEACENECDPITPLFCRNGVCECQDLLQRYDPNIKRCVGLVGSRCTRDKPNCVEFASCVIVDNKIGVGECICDKYSVEVSNRTCVINVS